MLIDLICHPTICFMPAHWLMRQIWSSQTTVAQVSIAIQKILSSLFMCSRQRKDYIDESWPERTRTIEDQEVQFAQWTCRKRNEEISLSAELDNGIGKSGTWSNRSQEQMWSPESHQLQNVHIMKLPTEPIKYQDLSSGWVLYPTSKCLWLIKCHCCESNSIYFWYAWLSWVQQSCKHNPSMVY